MINNQRTINFIRQHLEVLLWGFLLLSIGVFVKNQRRLLNQIHKLFYDYYNPPIQTKLPLKSLGEISDTYLLVSVTEPTYTQGNTTSYEQLVLSNIIKYHAPKKVFEIGTFDGRTTLNLAINCPSDAEVYTIDLSKDHTSQALLNVSPGDQKLIETNVTGFRFLTESAKSVLQGRKITQLLGDTATFDFSPYHNSFNFVFVDGAHTYEYVKSDSQVALNLLKNGKGLIVWHDYDYKHPGSVRAIEEIGQQFPDCEMYHIKDTNIAILIKK